MMKRNKNVYIIYTKDNKWILPEEDKLVLNKVQDNPLRGYITAYNPNLVNVFMITFPPSTSAWHSTGTVKPIYLPFYINNIEIRF